MSNVYQFYDNTHPFFEVTDQCLIKTLMDHGHLYLVTDTDTTVL
jgi:hypothetical protein